MKTFAWSLHMLVFWQFFCHLWPDFWWWKVLQWYFPFEAISKVFKNVWKFLQRSENGAFSVVTLWVATLKLPFPSHQQSLFSQILPDFWNYLIRNIFNMPSREEAESMLKKDDWEIWKQDVWICRMDWTWNPGRFDSIQHCPGFHRGQTQIKDYKYDRISK